jgi:hypothetical protein
LRIEHLNQRGRSLPEALHRVLQPGVRDSGRAGCLGRRPQPQREGQLAAQGLGLLEENPRHLRVDQDRRPHQQHDHVGPELVRGRIALAGAEPLGQRLRHFPRRTDGLAQDDGRLGADGAGPVVDLPEADHLVDDQDGDQQYQQPRHGVGGERVEVPPAPHPGVGQITDDQHAGQQRDDERGGPALPA